MVKVNDKVQRRPTRVSNGIYTFRLQANRNDRNLKPVPNDDASAPSTWFEWYYSATMPIGWGVPSVIPFGCGVPLALISLYSATGMVAAAMRPADRRRVRKDFEKYMIIS
jgi:hypothetical protein